MLIATTILRPGGSHYPMGDSVYHFAPIEGDEAMHYCRVDVLDHIARFLSIKGFHEAEDMQPEPVADLDAMDRDALASIYAKTFGKAPHWRLGEDVMRARIRAGSED
jgi:hypothetical protein